MTVHAINASVDPGLIGKVTRLFNQTEADIATELLQNARRACATRVVVTTTQHSHHSATLTIADNGHGIEDPTKLLRLGASGWDKETMRSEDPAGMGVFSLAGRRVRVTTRGTGSLGWSAVIEGADWTSGRDIEVHGCVRSMGTTFTVEISAGRIDDACKAIAASARYYPIEVELNGIVLERLDFLDGAETIEEFDGLRIGVFNAPDRYGVFRSSINFHGLTVEHKLPMVKEIASGNIWCTKIDIVDCPELQLTLPARKEIVATRFLEYLNRAVEEGIYGAIAKRGQHRLPYEDWCRAKVLGFDLAPAAEGLTGFVAITADPALADYRERIIRTGNDLVVVATMGTADEQSLSRALAVSNNAMSERLVRAEARLAGYDWYDRLARVESLRFVIKQGSAIYVDTLCGDLLNLDNPAVDAIAAELTVNEHGLEQVYQLNTDMLLQTDDNWDLEGASIAVVRGFESAICKLTPGILADYLDAAYFCHSDDRDCDSFDTQLRYWRSQSIILATSLLQGEEAATVASIEAAFHENLRWLIPADRVLRLEHGPSGTTIVLEPLAAADTAAPSV
ncbi:MAG: ATP-binding protein [Sphingomonas sp.]